MFLIFSTVIFFSCSSNSPVISETECSVVFYFDSRISLPSLGLTCYAKMVSPHDRVLALKLRHDETMLEWNITEPIFLGDSEEVWIGSSKLNVPRHHSLPQGDYTISVTDVAMESASRKIELNYPENFCSMTLDEVESASEYQLFTSESFAIYDNQEKLLYFGTKISDFNSDAQILAFFPSATNYRSFRFSPQLNTGLMLPPTYITGATQ